MSLSLKFTNASVKSIHFTFLLLDFRFRFRKHMISVTLMERFQRIFWMRESEQRFNVSQTCRNTFLVSTCFCLRTTQRVSPYSSDLGMNQTSSFLLQSDKLVIFPHLLLCKYSGEASRARICSSSKSDSGGGVAMPSVESQVEAMLGLWKNDGLTHESSCSARSLSSARCLWVRPDSHYSHVVDLRRYQSHRKGS